MPKPVAVIGGGITGLSAAFQLVSTGHRVAMFEREQRLGGKIDEVSLDGTTIPTGPDAFLARRHEVTDLVKEIGLGNALTSPTARSARIYRDGTLHPLPPNVLGVPATADLSSTGLISPAGAAIAARGPDSSSGVERSEWPDESVGALVRRELGDEVLEFLVDPLLGGINAGDSDQLSLVAGVPQLDALRKREGSLLDAAASTVAEAKQRENSSEPEPVFHSIEGGLGRLVERISDVLDASGLFDLHLGPTTLLERTGDGWRINELEADHVISTIPAHSTAQLVNGFAPEISERLFRIDYSSVALTILTLAPNTINIDAAISGVLVPRTLGHHVTAVSVASHKWPGLAAQGQQVLRVSVGRRTDERWTEVGDDELLAVIERDLAEIFGIEVRATHSVITRWLKSLPQYDVGHLDLIRSIDEQLAGHVGLHLTGAWRDGLGLPACVGAGRNAARAVTAQLTQNA